MTGFTIRSKQQNCFTMFPYCYIAFVSWRGVFCMTGLLNRGQTDKQPPNRAITVVTIIPSTAGPLFCWRSVCCQLFSVRPLSICALCLTASRVVTWAAVNRGLYPEAGRADLDRTKQSACPFQPRDRTKTGDSIIYNISFFSFLFSYTLIN